jgi:hypothetical protein
MGDLFYIAENSSIGVIYNIIASQMKTIHATAIDSAMNRLTRNHLFIAIAGVLIAIICAWVMLHDVNLLHHEATRSINIETPKTAIGEKIVMFTKLSLQTVMTVLK